MFPQFLHEEWSLRSQGESDQKTLQREANTDFFDNRAGPDQPLPTSESQDPHVPLAGSQVCANGKFPDLGRFSLDTVPPAAAPDCVAFGLTGAVMSCSRDITARGLDSASLGANPSLAIYQAWVLGRIMSPQIQMLKPFSPVPQNVSVLGRRAFK